VLSGCLSGPLSVPILAGDFGAALQKAEEMLEWFGEDFYLEIMPHSLPEQVQVNKALVRISDAMGIPLVATQDAHFVNACDHDAQSALLCVHTKDVLSNPDRFKFDTDEFYLKGRAEMEASFREHHGYMKASEIKASLDTTLEINEKITAQLKTDKFAAHPASGQAARWVHRRVPVPVAPVPAGLGAPQDRPPRWRRRGRVRALGGGGPRRIHGAD
jgi:DNA polymerase-3 subunit alpha